MLRNLSIRSRIQMLSAVLLLLSLGIAGVGYYALSAAETEYTRALLYGRKALLFLLGEREFAGAGRRLVGYIQTASEDDEKRYLSRKANSDKAFSEAIDLFIDPARKQQATEARKTVRDFLEQADAVMSDRKALAQHAAATSSARRCGWSRSHHPTRRSPTTPRSQPPPGRPEPLRRSTSRPPTCRLPRPLPTWAAGRKPRST